MTWAVVTLVVSFALDSLIGDPCFRFHPVRLMGHGISFFDRLLRGAGLDGKLGGLILVVIMEGATMGCFLAVYLVLSRIYAPLAMVFAMLVCYSSIALKDLIDHARKVIIALDGADLPGARAAVARIVGRDVRYLDGIGVCRATVETLGENFVDGVVSPLFWYMAGGLVGGYMGLPPVVSAVCFMLGFKVASTMDSMVGYKNEMFMDFGRAGARLDDLMNFIPARISAIMLMAGALITRLHPRDGMEVFLRDRLKHESPNAAHGESFVAGALHVRLGGPTIYPEGRKEKPWLGGEYPDPGLPAIRGCVSLVMISGWIAMVFSSLILSLQGAL